MKTFGRKITQQWLPALSVLLSLALLVACGPEAAKPDVAKSEAAPTPAPSATAQADGTTGNGGATMSSGTKTTDTPAAAPTVDIAEGVAKLLVPLVRRDPGADDPVKLERALSDLLESANLGNAESRSQVAAITVKSLLDKAKAAGGAGGALNALQQAALKEMSRQMAADLYRRLPAGGSAHLGALVGAARAVKLPDGCIEAPWSVLGGFSYEEGMKLPEPVGKLQGATVGLVGYMMTLEEVEDIHEFLLVESLWSCCFGKPPEVHQVVVVTIPHKKGVDMTPAPLLLTGVLDVGERVEDGFVISVYRLKAATFKELE